MHCYLPVLWYVAVVAAKQVCPHRHLCGEFVLAWHLLEILNTYVDEFMVNGMTWRIYEKTQLHMAKMPCAVKDEIELPGRGTGIAFDEKDNVFIV